MEPIRLHYSEQLVRRAVGAFWRRTVGGRLIIAIVCLLASLTFSLVRNDHSWWVGVSGTILIMGIAFAIAVYLVHYRGSMLRFRAMGNPDASFEAGEERFRIASGAGISELPWRAITEVWRYRDFWLLFFGRAQFITFPLEHVTVEAREYVLDKIRAHGGKLA